MGHGDRRKTGAGKTENKVNRRKLGDFKAVEASKVWLTEKKSRVRPAIHPFSLYLK